MSSETIVFSNSPPRSIDKRRSCRFWSNPVPPMVPVCKATSRPPEYGGFDLLHRLDDIGPDAPNVRHLRTLAHPESAINTMAEMFGEMTVDVSADDVSGFREVEINGVFRSLRQCRDAGYYCRDRKNLNTFFHCCCRIGEGVIFRRADSHSLSASSLRLPDLNSIGMDASWSLPR